MDSESALHYGHFAMTWVARRPKNTSAAGDGSEQSMFDAVARLFSLAAVLDTPRPEHRIDPEASSLIDQSVAEDGMKTGV